MPINLTGSLTDRTLGDLIADVRIALIDPAGAVAVTRTLGMAAAEVRAMLSDPAPSTGASLSGTITTLTLGVLIADTRSLLNDSVAPYRWSDADLYRYLADALLQARRIRPDLFITGNAGNLPSYTSASMATLFPLAEEYFPAFAQFVVSLAEAREDTFGADSKAAVMAEGFARVLLRAPYRHSDTDIYRYMSHALLVLRRVRADLFLNTDTHAAEYTPASASVAFPVDEAVYPAFVRHVVGLAHERDELYGPDPKPGMGVALQDAAVAAMVATPYHWEDDELYRYISRGLAEARRMRPDLFLFGKLLRMALPIYTPANAATPFPLDERYFSAMQSWVVGMALSRNGELKADSPAGVWLGMFAAQLGT